MSALFLAASWDRILSLLDTPVSETCVKGSIEGSDGAVAAVATDEEDDEDGNIVRPTKVR